MFKYGATKNHLRKISIALAERSLLCALLIAAGADPDDILQNYKKECAAKAERHTGRAGPADGVPLAA